MKSIYKNSSYASAIQNGLKQVDGLSPFFFQLSFRIRYQEHRMEPITSWSTLTMLIWWMKT